MADKHPINLPKKPNKDPEGTSWQRTADTKAAQDKINKDSRDKNPDGV